MQVQRTGRDIHTDLEISLQEAYSGVTRPVTFDTKRPCDSFQGTGRLKKEQCCPACQGQARLADTQTLAGIIPAGVGTGTKVRIPGAGEPGIGGGQPGQLFLHISVRFDPLFQREADDLHGSIEVEQSVALAGGQASIVMPDGKMLWVTIPAGTRFGTLLRVIGSGMPILSSTQCGNLFVRVHISMRRGEPVHLVPAGTAGQAANRQLGHYRLIRQLGADGFDEVFLSEHLYLKTPAAIKVLRQATQTEAVQAFRKEAQLVASLNHPHIVRILDFGIEGSTPSLVMDYAAHGTLRGKHPRGSTVPVQQVAFYISQVARALQFAHERKIVHRDVKPENMLLLDAAGTVALSDFGIAIAAHHNAIALITASLRHGCVHGAGTHSGPDASRQRPVCARRRRLRVAHRGMALHWQRRA